RALSHHRSGPARDRRRGRAPPHEAETARASLAIDLRRCTAAAHHAVVSDALGHDAARLLGGDHRRDPAARCARDRAAPARILPPGPMAVGAERPERRLAAVLLAPALTVLAGVTLYPLAQALVLSIERRVPVFGIDEFVGLRHYAFLVRDPAFANALRVT